MDRDAGSRYEGKTSEELKELLARTSDPAEMEMIVQALQKRLAKDLESKAQEASINKGPSVPPGEEPPRTPPPQVEEPRRTQESQTAETEPAGARGTPTQNNIRSISWVVYVLAVLGIIFLLMIFMAGF